MRLLNDKPSFIWETKLIKNVRRDNYDWEKLENFIIDIKKSDRVSPFIKNKNFDELLDYYLMADGDYLTNLGILWIGRRNDRAKLSYAPVIQFLFTAPIRHGGIFLSIYTLTTWKLTIRDGFLSV
ncbi:hypothetical protein LQZ19_13480 [Treponema primitia]|uniref:hypothetical protein n=1 Tax=Treponema primitia TaxID=88058 RepID=UPI00398116AE